MAARKMKTKKGALIVLSRNWHSCGDCGNFTKDAKTIYNKEDLRRGGTKGRLTSGKAYAQGRGNRYGQAV